MKSIDTFKTFMTSDHVPNYVLRYCNGLDEGKWQWFYDQMKEPIEFAVDIEHLFYVLKYNFDDLSYSVFFQEVMDTECSPRSLIKDEYWAILQERYHKQLEMDILQIHYDWTDESVAEVIHDDIVVIF